MMSVFGHDQLQSILMFLQRRPQLLVLLLQGSDVSVLLLDAQHQLRPGSVVRHLVQVLNVLLVIRFDQNYFTFRILKIISVHLVLSHSIHLLQHLLRPDNNDDIMIELLTLDYVKIGFDNIALLTYNE